MAPGGVQTEGTRNYDGQKAGRVCLFLPASLPKK